MIERDKFYFRLFCFTFWVMAVGNFVFEEILNIAEKRLILILITDLLMLFLGIVTLRQKKDKIYIAVFVVLGIVSSLVNNVPTAMWINGFRDYIPLLLGLPVLRYFFTCDDADEYRESFDRQLKIFLILQAICVTEQFLRYGANDHGGGSLGNLASGNISICIVYISFYFICKNWDGENYMKSLWRNRLYIFLLFPVFLNETKVSFVLLFVYFMLLYPFNIKSVGKIIIALPVMLIVAVGMFYAYMAATGGDNDFSASGFIEDYLSGGANADEIMELAETAMDYVEEATDTWDENDWAYVDIPRFMKFPLLWTALEDSKGGFVLGAGLGHLKGGNTLEQTAFARDHMGLLFGTRMTVHLIVLPLGLLGLIWIILWYKHSLMMNTRVGKMALQIKLFLLFLAVLNFFYHDSFRYLIPCVVFYYMSLSATYPLKTEEADEQNA